MATASKCAECNAFCNKNDRYCLRCARAHAEKARDNDDVAQAVASVAKQSRPNPVEVYQSPLMVTGRLFEMLFRECEDLQSGKSNYQRASAFSKLSHQLLNTAKFQHQVCRTIKSEDAQ